jgi:endonuclease YncB( thermonuclease family)
MFLENRAMIPAMPQALLLLLLLYLPVFAQTGNVVGVSCGDKITVLANQTRIKVRLAGTDVPEEGPPFATVGNVCSGCSTGGF